MILWSRTHLHEITHTHRHRIAKQSKKEWSTPPAALWLTLTANSFGTHSHQHAFGGKVKWKCNNQSSKMCLLLENFIRLRIILHTCLCVNSVFDHSHTQTNIKSEQESKEKIDIIFSHTSHTHTHTHSQTQINNNKNSVIAPSTFRFGLILFFRLIFNRSIFRRKQV